MRDREAWDRLRAVKVELGMIRDHFKDEGDSGIVDWLDHALDEVSGALDVEDE